MRNNNTFGKSPYFIALLFIATAFAGVALVQNNRLSQKADDAQELIFDIDKKDQQIEDLRKEIISLKEQNRVLSHSLSKKTADTSGKVSTITEDKTVKVKSDEFNTKKTLGDNNAKKVASPLNAVVNKQVIKQVDIGYKDYFKNLDFDDETKDQARKLIINSALETTQAIFLAFDESNSDEDILKKTEAIYEKRKKEVDDLLGDNASQDLYSYEEKSWDKVLDKKYGNKLDSWGLSADKYVLDALRSKLVKEDTKVNKSMYSPKANKVSIATIRKQFNDPRALLEGNINKTKIIHQNTLNYAKDKLSPDDYDILKNKLKSEIGSLEVLKNNYPKNKSPNS